MDRKTDKLGEIQWVSHHTADSPSHAQQSTVILSPLVMYTHCRKLSRQVKNGLGKRLETPDCLTWWWKHRTLSDPISWHVGAWVGPLHCTGHKYCRSSRQRKISARSFENQQRHWIQHSEGVERIYKTITWSQFIADFSKIIKILTQYIYYLVSEPD